MVLHTDRPRWGHAGRPGPTAAAPGPPAGRFRPVPRRLRDGGHDHGPRERPRRGRGLDRHVSRSHPGTRPRPVLPPPVRRSGVGHVVVALWRPPRLDPPHRRRRRGPLVHAELHGCGSGVVAAPRPTSVAAAGGRRGPGPRARPCTRRRPAGAGRPRPRGADRHRRRQSASAVGRGPADPAEEHLARRAGRRVHRAPGGHATPRRGGDRSAAGGPRGRAPHPGREPGQGCRRVGARRWPAGAAAGPPRGLCRAGAGGARRRGSAEVLRRPPAGPPLRVGRRPRARPAPLLPGAGTAPLGRVRQHAAGRQPRRTPSGATRTATSAATSWPSTTPRTTRRSVAQLSTAVARCQTCRSSSISAPVPPGGITSGSPSRARTTAT